MSRPIRSTLVAVAALLALGTAQPAAATLVTVMLAGEVTDVQNGNPFGIVASIGDAVTATFTYDTAAAGQAVNQATAYAQTAPSSYQLVIDGIIIEPDTNDWLVAFLNEALFDAIYFEHNSNLPGTIAVDGVPESNAEFQIRLEDTTGTLLVDETALPLIPALGQWTNAGGFFRDNATAATIYFDITSLTQVPEPGTLSLLALGLATVACAGRRRER